MLKFLRTHLWIILFGLLIGVNLIHYRTVDIFFTMIALAAFAEAFRNQRSPFKLLFISHTFSLWILFFVFSCTAGYILNGFTGSDQISEVLELRWVLGFYSCAYLGSKIGTKSKYISLVPVITLLALGVLIFDHYRINPFNLVDIRYRFRGFYENPNHFALAAILLWGYYLPFLTNPNNTSPSSRGLYLLTFLTLTFSLLATYSRTSWLGGLFVVLIATVFSPKKKLSFSLLLSGLVIFGGLYTFNIFSIQDRIISSLNISPNGPEGGRFSVWIASFHIFLDHPLFGVGIEQASRLYDSYYQNLGLSKEFIVGHAHNQFLQILAGAGIFGFVAYLGILINGLFFFGKHAKAEDSKSYQVGLASLLVIIALITCSFTDAPFRLPECRNFLLILLGTSFGFLKTQEIQK